MTDTNVLDLCLRYRSAV